MVHGRMSVFCHPESRFIGMKDLTANCSVTGKLIRVSQKVEGWPITVVGTWRGLAEIHFSMLPARDETARPPWVGETLRQLAEYFSGHRKDFELPMDSPEGTPFQKRVWSSCQEIPYGRVSSYGALARRLACPGAARAVGQALRRNPLPLIVPCHRVVTARGELGGFSAGLDWKRRLLRLESAISELWSWNHGDP